MAKVTAWVWAGLALAAVLAADGRGRAEDVRWRHDYAAARKEAADTGRPLFLDFGTENCVWCRRLDATTFRAPAVAKLLNERFVPVKVDGNEHTELTQALGITGFPTLIVAAPDGKVIGRQDGYLDAAGMTNLLGRAPAPKPAAVAAAPVPVPVAGPLALAQGDYAAGRYADCLDRCRQLAAGPDAPAALTLADRISADPAAWRQACDQITARLDELYPALDAGLKR